MNVNCPKCGIQDSLSNFGEGLKQKENARWYEPSDEYTAKVCPSCGTNLRFSMDTKIKQNCSLNRRNIFSRRNILFDIRVDIISSVYCGTLLYTE